MTGPQTDHVSHDFPRPIYFLSGVASSRHGTVERSRHTDAPDYSDFAGRLTLLARDAAVQRT